MFAIQWASMPFLRFVLAFMAGILFYIHTAYQFNYFLCFFVSAAAYIALSIASSNAAYFHTLKSWIGFTGLAVLFFFGSLLTELRDEKNDKLHILQQERILCYQARVLRNSDEREKTYRTEINIENIKTTRGWSKAKGKVLLYTPKTGTVPFQYGDLIMVKGSPGLTQAPANPFEFDYRGYLRFQQVHHTHFVRSNNLHFIKNAPSSRLIQASVFLREKARTILYTFIKGDDEYKIASALILGIRSTLDNELKNAYSSTGTMHVLAVSGLHVGIVLGLLMLLLRFMKFFSTGKILLPVTLIFCLWIYAFVTGFSASVLRAAVMFSLIIIARSLRRNTNINNTLALAAFVLLCINPFFIMEAGFQLSFLAVLGIVYFQPRIYKLFSFKNIVIDKAWLPTSVSIAAQITTLPVTIYYFHQIPLNFVVSNLAAIPLSFAILYSGIMLLLFSWIPGLNIVLGWITEKGIAFMNWIIFRIEDIPYSVLRKIDLDLPEVILLYLFIFFISCFFFYKRIYYLKGSTLFFVCFSFIQVLETIEQKDQKRLIVFRIPNHRAIGCVEGKTINIFSDSALIADINKQAYHIDPYLTQYGIEKITYVDIENNNKKIPVYKKEGLMLICFQGKSFLIREKATKEFPENFRADYIFNSKEATEVAL